MAGRRRREIEADVARLTKAVDGNIEGAIERLRSAEVSQDGHARAAALLADDMVMRTVPEATLHSEWRNDVVLKADADEMKVIRDDADASYLSFVSDRIQDPYALSTTALTRIRKTHGAEFSADFAIAIWPSQMAWASRYRRQADPRKAVLAQTFLNELLKNRAEVAFLMARSSMDLDQDLGWLDSRERVMDPILIHELDDVPEDVATMPFLMVADDMKGALIDATPMPKLQAIAATLAREEERWVRLRASRMSSRLVGENRLDRIVDVLEEAEKAGLTSNELVAATAAFERELASGAVEVGRRPRYPFTEFVDFIRVREKFPLPDGVRYPNLRPLEGQSSVVWIARLPLSYRSLGSGAARNFQEWHGLLQSGERTLPVDLVTDYGMFLLEQRRKSVPRRKTGKVKAGAKEGSAT